jgi:allophanate hydrolase subunit 1
VPAGSVAIAAEYSAVYPTSSPGGWHLLGRLHRDAPSVWDLDRGAPALLGPGTLVRFVAR